MLDLRPAPIGPRRSKNLGTPPSTPPKKFLVFCSHINYTQCWAPRARKSLAMKNDPAVDHPAHYGGADNPYEAIKVIEAWGLGFCLGNAVKYIARAGKKAATVQDLKKARWYLDHEIKKLEASE